jgi:cystathionine gamma-synthase
LPCTPASRGQSSAHALTTPIIQTATYTFADTRELRDHFERRIEREEYGRYGNPTQRTAEQKLAALEGAEDCLLFASGMAAVTTTLYAVLSHNSHVVVTDDSYRRTRQFLTQVLHRYGVEVSVVPAGDYEAMAEAIRPTTRVLISESPTNPYNYIVDLERFADIGRRHRVKTLIDATFATPFNQAAGIRHRSGAAFGEPNISAAQRPARGRGARISRTRGWDSGLQAVTGAIVDPFVAYLLVRGLKTFALRIARQNANAQALAEFLAAHPRVSAVYYAGLPTHPQHQIARRQMRGFGGVVSFEVAGNLDAASRVVGGCRIPHIAPSLGRRV